MFGLSILMFAFVSAQVSELNRTNYLGRWYQMYTDAFVDLTFENSSYCVTADYSIYPNDTISVLNRERQFNVSGPERRVLGWADVENPSNPGELTVHLQTAPFPAPYWVYKLGPIVDDLYDYSIVSDPDKLTLFVLARNISVFREKYDTNISDYLKHEGFTGLLNTPIPTVQENCIYS